MCWVCHEREQSIYRKCDGCDKAFNRSNLKEYDMFTRWKEIAEFVNQRRFIVFCSDCIEEMDKYRDYLVSEKPRTEIMIPENGMPEWRYILRRAGKASVGIHHFAEQLTLGIRCAKLIYGVDAVEEMLQGFVYHDDGGHQIKRLTPEDVDGKMRCDKCWLLLDECNSMEVTR